MPIVCKFPCISKLLPHSSETLSWSTACVCWSPVRSDLWWLQVLHWVHFVYGHIDVSSGRVQCPCRTTVHQYPKLLHDNTCVQPLVTGWWFRDIGSARTAVGHLLLLAWWSSTFCRWAAWPHRQHNFHTTFKDTFFLELSKRLAH